MSLRSRLIEKRIDGQDLEKKPLDIESVPVLEADKILAIEEHHEGN